MTDTTQPPAETLAERTIVARALAQRFIDRGSARVTGSPYSCWEEMPGSYKRDFYDDADAILAALTRRAGGDAIGQSDGDPDGWLAVKVNGEGGIVMPYGPLHAGPDRPNDSRYRWAPFYIGDTK